jgi:hypothetical protein
MTTLSLRLPVSLHKRLALVAEREGISINQLIASAVGEKMAALETEELLATRAARGDRQKFLAVLARVPDVEPLAGDEVPPTAKSRRSTAARTSRKAG